MDPWYLLALLAGALGVGILASNAAAQANAMLPRVTSFGIVAAPIPGVNSTGDMWVTGINGLTGMAMLRLIPGAMQAYAALHPEIQTWDDARAAGLIDDINAHSVLFIPASVLRQQPTNVDFKYTFTPRGATLPYTLLVPASILQQYAVSHALSPGMQRIEATLAAAQAAQKGVAFWVNPALLSSSATSSNACNVLQPDNIVNQVQSAIHNFPAEGSDWTAYVSWGATYGMKVYNDANDLMNCINSKQLSDTGGWMNYLLTAAPQLMGLVTKAVSNSIPKGGDMPSDAPSDAPSDVSDAGF